MIREALAGEELRLKNNELRRKIRELESVVEAYKARATILAGHACHNLEVRNDVEEKKGD